MALLRLSDGRVYTTIEDISQHIDSARIGTFNYPAEFRQKVAELTLPLTKEGVDYIAANLDAAAVKQVNDDGLTYRTMGCVIPPKNEGDDFVFAFGATAEGTTPAQKSPEELAAYRTPHAVQVTDWHFAMSGAFVKGMQLENGLQAVLYIQPGEWLRFNANVKNWPIFPCGQPTIGVSFFDKEPGSFGQIEFPELAVLPDMCS